MRKTKRHVVVADSVCKAYSSPAEKKKKLRDHKAHMEKSFWSKAKEASRGAKMHYWKVFELN